MMQTDPKPEFPISTRYKTIIFASQLF